MGVPYFPLFVRLEGQRIGVVGGGQTAERKVEALLPFGARVRLIAPRVTPRLAYLHESRNLQWVASEYHKEHIQDCYIVIAATDNPAVNRQVAEDCRALSIPCNVVDEPELCDFFFPALYVVDSVSIGISTGGRAPALSGALRRWLDRHLPAKLIRKVLADAVKQRPHLSAEELYAALEEYLSKHNWS